MPNPAYRMICVSLLSLVVVASTPQRQQMSLKAVREAIEAKKSGTERSSRLLDLSGYTFDWELGIGGRLRVLVISRNLAGDLLVFREDGSLIHHENVGEITRLQLFDFDGDGVAEIVAEELRARGTGILIREFHVYRVQDSSVDDLWHGVAYCHKLVKSSVPGGDADFEVQRGFLHLEPPGGGAPNSLLFHLVEISVGSRESHTERHAYEFIKKHFREVAWRQ